MVSSPQSSAPVAPSSASTGSDRHLDNTDHSLSHRHRLSGLVDFRRNLQGIPLPGPSQVGSHHRCKSVRVGCPPGSPPDPGPMVPKGTSTQHQRAGASSHLSSSPTFHGARSGPTRPSADRQRLSQGPREQVGRYPVDGSHARSAPSGSMGGDPPGFPAGCSHIRGDKRHGRLPEPLSGRSDGMESSSSPLRRPVLPVRHPCGGPICLRNQPPAPEILHSVPNSRSGGSGRLTQPVASWSSSLCLSAASTHFQSHQETPSGTGGAPSSGPSLASPPMVLGPGLPVGSSSLETPRRQNLSGSGAPHSSRTPVVPAHRLEVERFLLTKALVPPEVIPTIQASRRPSTNRIYDATWLAFSSWCKRRQLTPTSASIIHILGFLQSGLESGLAPNTLRRQTAAISSVLTCGSSDSISRHPVIRSFLRGASNLRPPPVHRFPTWDLPRVLSALTKPPFEPLRDVSLRSLSFKVSFLIAITSARRISELAALSIRQDLCVIHNDRVILRLDPTFIPKVNSTFHRAQELILPNFCPSPRHRLERTWHTLDVRRALKIYISRTSAFRRTEALFVSFLPSSLGSKVTATVLGRWIRATISLAYESQGLPVPRNVTAHSTRSAATSAAWSTQASLEEVCRAATWASPTPFIRHYKLDSYASAEAAFGRRVLQGISSVSV